MFQVITADGRVAYYFEVGSVNQLEAELDKHQDLLGLPWNQRLFITYEKPSFPLGQVCECAYVCVCFV